LTKQKNDKMASCENEKLTKQQADKTTQIKSRVDQMKVDKTASLAK